MGSPTAEPETRMSGCVSDVSDVSYGHGGHGTPPGPPKDSQNCPPKDRRGKHSSIRFPARTRLPGPLGFLCLYSAASERPWEGGGRYLADAGDRMWAARAGASCCITQLSSPQIHLGTCAEWSLAAVGD